MARTLGTLTLTTQAVIESECWTLDPVLPPIPWKGETFKDFTSRSLVIGLMLDDGMVKVHPPVERVFKDLSQKLKTAGHELVQWDTSLNADCIQLMVRVTVCSLKT